MTRALCLLLLALGCGRRTSERAGPAEEDHAMQHADDPECAATIRTLVVDGDLSSGRGLPAGCRADDAARALGGNAELGTGRLSERERRWRKYRIGGDAVARVWLDEDDRVLLIDVSHPPVREAPDAIRARLGAPAGTLRARNDPVDLEWLYPDRGLTITIGGKYEDPPRPHVSYLFVYAPTTMADYIGRLGGNDPWVVRRPVRR